MDFEALLSANLSQKEKFVKFLLTLLIFNDIIKTQVLIKRNTKEDKNFQKFFEYFRRIMMAIEPLSDYVLVKPKEEAEQRVGMIIIPDTAQEKPAEGEIIAVGPGRVAKDGKVIPLEVQIGNKVIYRKHAGTEAKVGEAEYLIIKESDILAIIE
jgi:chaperonin GroES